MLVSYGGLLASVCGEENAAGERRDGQLRQRGGGGCAA